MAKRIKMTPELKQECRTSFLEEFEKALSSAKFGDGKLSFTKSLGTVDRKARVYFTEIAWMKITTLLREFSKEVAWHATAYRIPGDKDEYLIKDVLVYPQTVTSATVDMDVENYAQWIMDNIDDDRFNNIRCQMHSHVHMSVFASGTDIQHQEEILEQLGDNDFYIFMIWNKRHDVYMRIFDIQKNILFETGDISWAVLEDTVGLSRFLEDAKKMVKEQTYAPSTYQGYGKSPNYTPQAYSGPYNPVSQVGAGSNYGSAGSGGYNGNGNNGKGKGKGGKKDKKKTKFSAGKNACDEQITVLDENGEPFDMSDPFGFIDGRFHIS